VSVQGRPQDYAAAIYDLAFEPWLEQLGNIQRVLKGDATLRAALDDPRTSNPDKLQRLSQAVPKPLTADVRKFMGILFEAGQLDQLDAILLEFDHLVRRRPELKVAQVTSAVALTEAEKDALRAKLVNRFGQELEFEFNVDASLIGGVYLRIGDQVIDGSVSGKLAALRDRLTG
jgi:F-type H+-transporting ATPase subunit delta